MQKYANIVDFVKSFPPSIFYVLAKISVDSAENEPLKVWRLSNLLLHSPHYAGPNATPRGAGAAAVVSGHAFCRVGAPHPRAGAVRIEGRAVPGGAGEARADLHGVAAAAGNAVRPGDLGDPHHAVAFGAT